MREAFRELVYSRIFVGVKCTKPESKPLESAAKKRIETLLGIILSKMTFTSSREVVHLGKTIGETRPTSSSSTKNQILKREDSSVIRGGLSFSHGL